MSTDLWDPERYLAFEDERGRPYLDLLSRVRAASPAVVADLGCGPGNMTHVLARRWPEAGIRGVDSSASMIATARLRPGPVDFQVGRVEDWRDPVDVLISNATLQWLPNHLELLPRLLDTVNPGGWLAFGVPGNFAAPSHTLRIELAQTDQWAAKLAGVAEPSAYDATTYLQTLAGPGVEVDAWETTYLHVLTGPDPVWTWISGTSARPMLDALEPADRDEFVAQLKAKLNEAYPTRDGRVVLGFRRVFVVAHKEDR